MMGRRRNSFIARGEISKLLSIKIRTLIYLKVKEKERQSVR